jgi:protein-S-isoprenylcysteine O-methyltransferase Ste14
MNMIYIQTIGCGIFVISSILLGIWLRVYPSKRTAETTSRIVHGIAGLTYILPLIIGIFYPGLKHYDVMLGIPHLPFSLLFVAVAAIILPIGIFFIAATIFALGDRGQGQPGFFLTKELVDTYLFKFTRNPGSLGFYLILLSLALFSSSFSFTVWVVVILIPAHIFHLKYFEEVELELRFGHSYTGYKNRVPFIIPRFRNVSVTEFLNGNS